jgi:OPA family glycerol-3-phosphate transporter-like MFS transporter
VNRSLFWRTLTLALMIAGYAGYYLCRSNFSVAVPMLIQEMGTRGIPAKTATVQLGAIASWGVLAYAIGKFPSGWLADFLGGRRNFLYGMGGSILFTVLFAIGGGIPVFTLAWFGNRLVQSLGWAGMVKISSRWFSYSTYGTVMGLISLSYLFGDAAARQFMAILISHGIGWRGVFFAAAAVLSVLLLLNLAFLRETPQSRGLEEPEANPLNLFHTAGGAARPTNLRLLLKTFAVSPVFWLVCLISVGVTLMRETFNVWTPAYFTQALGLTNADAAQKSALFPLFGGLSVVLAGFLSDKLGPKGRALIIFVGLLLTSGVLLVLTLLTGAPGATGSTNLRVWLVALVAFLMLGPYSYFAGAISLDFGGKQGSATASGWIDGLSYLGGVMAGSSMASVTVNWGWRGAFAVLAAVALFSSGAAGIYFYSQQRSEC